MNFLSPDGICYAFDERANGYARGEGMASIIIKPLSAAIRDNDTIRAVVRGTGVNSDGRTPGITQPSYEAQVSLIRSVYDRFDLDMSQTRYFEAHGTGTQLGDSLEAKAIATAFYQRGTSPLFVGTVKSNIGHLGMFKSSFSVHMFWGLPLNIRFCLEGASGLAGLIKAMLVLENKLITPNIWLDRINPSIKDEWGLSFPTKATPFPGDTPRRASVNSFGFGGTNAHAVLDAAESFNERDHQKDLRESRDGSSPPAESTPSSAKLFVWSAADERGIDRLNDSYRLYFQNRKHGEGGHDPQHFENLVYTLSYRRSHLSWRSFSICDSPSTSLDCIPSEAIRVNSKLQICYVFTGQGAQWVSMGQELLSYDAFQRSLEESDTLLGKLGCQFSVLGGSLESYEIN